MFRRSGLFLLAATPLVVVLAAFSALAVSQDAAGGHDHAHRAAAGITAKELKLRNDMRRLWEDHVTWTRLAVISLTTSSPDTKATVGRLLRNQVHIGNAVKPYYGRAAGVELTRLLREHITIAAALVAAAKDGDQAALASSRRRWEANADEIARFLSRANPRWKPAPTRAMMRDHLRLTAREVVARLQHKWTADIAAYDPIHRQALHMADMLSTGIVAQFPRRFR
ncbi:MAG TPA: hypothetical protein VKB13_07755 [Gaiellaceae bacterium]|nr:hypothetical protein [Gaiellaceae bacterium]